MSAEMRKVGKVKDAHGIKGDLYILIFSGDVSWLPKLSNITLETAKGQINLTPLKTRPHKDGFIVQTKELTNRNQAEELKGALFYLPKVFFQTTDSDEEGFYLVEIENFIVLDESLGELGPITGFSSNGAQDLILVTGKDDYTYEIPLVEEFILDIDYDTKRIEMRLPEGLLETQNESFGKK